MYKSMTITRALVELKRLNDRIDQAIREGVFVGRKIGKGKFEKVAGQMPAEALTSKIIASYDKVESLLANRDKIKSAIIASNASTYVTFRYKSLTVAELIAMKDTLPLRKQYLAAVRQSRQATITAIEKANTELDQAIENSLNNAYGSDRSKLDSSIFDAIATPQREQKENSLLDPKGIDEKISEIESEISDIESELDFLLSESNAQTMITVDLT